MSASELSYLGLLNGPTFRAEPEQSQIGSDGWPLTEWLHCVSVTYGMTSSSTYYYTKAMTDLFVNTAGDCGVKFQSISTMTDFWTVSFPSVFISSMFTTLSLTNEKYDISSPCDSNSTPRVHYWMASTGPNGTITSPWTVETSPSSTMRTCCWECPEWGRSRLWTTPATSMMTLKMRSWDVSTFTMSRRRTAVALVSSMALRKLTLFSLHGHFMQLGGESAKVSSSFGPVGLTTQRKKSKVPLTGACWQHTVEEDTIKTWARTKRRAPSSWRSWWTTCGSTEGPEWSSSTSPLTTQTSTCSASSGKARLQRLYPSVLTHPLVDQRCVCFFQVGSWIPTDWWSNPFPPDKNSQTDTIYLLLGFLHPRLWGGLLFVHPLLYCGGDSWVAYTQVLLLSQHLEHPGYCCHNGKEREFLFD